MRRALDEHVERFGKEPALKTVGAHFRREHLRDIALLARLRNLGAELVGLLERILDRAQQDRRVFSRFDDVVAYLRERRRAR